MKIICTDNYGRESVAERLVAENIKNSDEASSMCAALNKIEGGSSDHYLVKEDDYRLWRGMEELV